jgi:hypothetical protein
MLVDCVWYRNSVLRPLLASVFIAVDPNTRENGCMQVLKGSHALGRVEHGRFGDQTGADPERVEEAKKSAARNNPYKESHHPRYSYLEKVDDGAIKLAGAKLFAEGAKSCRCGWMRPRPLALTSRWRAGLSGENRFG